MIKNVSQCQHHQLVKAMPVLIGRPVRILPTSSPSQAASTITSALLGPRPIAKLMMCLTLTSKRMYAVGSVSPANARRDHTGVSKLQRQRVSEAGTDHPDFYQKIAEVGQCSCATLSYSS